MGTYVVWFQKTDRQVVNRLWHYWGYKWIGKASAVFNRNIVNPTFMPALIDLAAKLTNCAAKEYFQIAVCKNLLCRDCNGSGMLVLWNQMNTRRNELHKFTGMPTQIEIDIVL